MRKVLSKGPISFYFSKFLFEKTKVETIQLHAWTGPEGSRRLRLPDFKTINT
jgi:hypothetical protein